MNTTKIVLIFLFCFNISFSSGGIIVSPGIVFNRSFILFNLPSIANSIKRKIIGQYP